MLEYVGYGLLFIFMILKTLALFQASKRDVPAREKLQRYKKYNLPSYLFLVSGLGILVYLRYFS